MLTEIASLLEEINTVKLASRGFTDEAQSIGLARLRLDELLRRIESEGLIEIREGKRLIRNNVFAWLGVWRDKLTCDAVTQLQDILESAGDES